MDKMGVVQEWEGIDGDDDWLKVVCLKARVPCVTQSNVLRFLTGQVGQT